MGEDLLTTETETTPVVAAETLRSIAEQLDAGETLRLEAAGRTVTVPLAERLELELELEREEESDDEIELELEIELEWVLHGGDESEGAAAGIEIVESDVRAEDDEADAADAADAAEEIDDADENGAVAPVVVEDVEPSPEAVDEASSTSDETRASDGQFQLFEDRAGEWRWRLVHRNGNVIATGGEGYTTKRNARKGIRSVVRNAPGAGVVEAEEGAWDVR